MHPISKFYLLDAVTPNSGTMPGAGTAFAANAVSGDAAGARTSRDATDLPGTSNPDIESTVTSTASTLLQRWGHRRFVSRPLAAVTLTNADGNWTFSYARQESNLNHNQSVQASVYGWRPSTGARVGTGASNNLVGTEPTVAATQQAEAVTAAWSGVSLTLIDGDILVFEVVTEFTQAMATAYTDAFAYNGTTEASTTTCASFITPPIPIQLRREKAPATIHSATATFCERIGRSWDRARSGIWLPTYRSPERPVIA